MGRAASARRPRWGAARHASAAARRRRAGAALHLLGGALSSAKHRCPVGSCAGSIHRGPLDALTASLLSETGRFSSNAGVSGADPAPFHAGVEPETPAQPSPGRAALPYQVLGRRSRTVSWANEQLGGAGRDAHARTAAASRLPKYHYIAPGLPSAARRRATRQQTTQVDHGPSDRQRLDP